MDNQKTILYVRTDLGAESLIAGGSVSHTVGVLQGFLDGKYKIMCASAAMVSILQAMPLDYFKQLKVPRLISFFGHKISAILSNLFFAYSIFGMLRTQKVDVVYQRYSLLNTVGLWIARKKKIPLILEFNGSEVWADKHWAPTRWLRFTKLINWFEQKNIAGADYIVVVSNALKDWLLEQGCDAKKIIVNPNGVNANIFDPEKLYKKRIEIQAALGLESNYIFGFVGTFSYWHGVELLAQVIPKVIVQRPHAHFMLIGSGPLFANIQKTLEERQITSEHVTLCGTVTHKIAREYLAVCDAFLCPTQPNSDGSRFFGSPTKLFEYLSLGKPVIVSDIEQLAEVVDSSVGIKVAPTDVQGFVDAACQLIDTHEEIQKKMGNSARNKVLQNYTWNKHVQRIINASRCL